jgi:hypothetical protein
LNWADNNDPGYVKKIDPVFSAYLATQNMGGFLILALMTKEIIVNGAKVQKNHVAIVLDGDYDSVDGPKMGGGGMTQANIDKGWVLSNARIHFTNWKEASYYMYCYKKEK